MQTKEAIRVLLVEDNLVNQAIALKLLKSKGFSVETATTGIAALQAFQQKQFDIVLMDIQMPEMDGFEATKRIRAYEKSLKRHTPIIAVTAHDDMQNRNRALEVGMDDFLPKPIRPSELGEMINSLLEKSSSRQTAAKAATAAGVVTSRPKLNASRSVGLSEALTRLNGDVELLQELAEAFIEDYSKWQDRFDDAVEHGDLSSISHGARELQSSMRNFTVTEAIATTMRLEELSKEGDVTRLKEACSELDQQISPFLSVLRGLVGRRREVMRG